MATQTCPNCERQHDVGVYVTGQRVLCSCGIHFEVRRSDVTGRTVNLRPSLPRNHAGGGGDVAQAQAAAALEVTFKPTSNVARGEEIAVDSKTFVHTPSVSLPGYELTQLLGRGGMGEVWRATQVSLGRQVAVKLLPPDLARDPEFVARFEKEATALAALSHPHIIQIIDRGIAGAHYYFVMEFVEGRSLRELLTRARPTPQETLRIVLQILRAMEAAHDKQIIHRDLKPENILVDARGHVKVADFGLAGMRDVEERLQLTATAVAMGTINYMAPEQRRDARNVDARADLYAVGVILYELLTGELPIGRFRMPSERVPGLDVRFDEVVGRLLDADPEHRYPSASEAIAALEPLQSGASLSSPSLSMAQAATAAPAAGASQITQARSFVEKGFRGVRNGLMVIGVLAVVGLGSRWLWGEEDAPKVTISAGGKQMTLSPNGLDAPVLEEAAPKLPASGNTYDEVFAAFTQTVDEDGVPTLKVTFEPGDEEFNVHTGEWSLQDGALHVLQAGNDPGEDRTKLVPRAYIAKRYYSTDEFEAEVTTRYRDVRDRYEVPEDAQRFAELAFRIKDLQVSAFAIPGVGMRLGWKYFTPQGIERAGNSSRDLELLVGDEMPAPPDGKPFRLGLRLRKVNDEAVEAIGYLNGDEFARKVLRGLHGQVGKVALGCRNYECWFDDLVVTGPEVDRSKKTATAP